MRLPKNIASLICLLILTSCSVTGYEDSFKVSDKRVEELVRDTSTPHYLLRKDPGAEARPETGKMTLTLVDCVNTALKSNRRYLNEIENLFLKRIEAGVEKHNYFPLLDPLSMSYLSTWQTSWGTPSETQTDAYSGTMGVSQKIPIGGSVTAGGTLTHSADRMDSAGRSATLSPSATLTLPLLKGGGLVVGMESLVASERAHKYAQREVENFKQAFLIDIVERFATIVSSQKEIVNLETNYESAKQLRIKSDTLFKFGKVSKVEVFRAQFQETEAERDLLLAREGLRLSLDAFKIDLGISPEAELSLKDEEVAVKPVEADEKKYIASVVQNNILWKNTQDQLEDSKRALLIAHDQTLPQADLAGSWQLARGADGPFDNFDNNSERWQAGLTMSIPLDRTSIDATYHKNVVAYVQAERSFQLSRDTLVREARAQLVSVRQAQFRLTAQKNAVEQAQSALKLLRFQYERGLVTNRDVIDAQSNFIRAQNSYLRAAVDHKVACLRLRQFEGTLETDEKGEWLK
jgi:outer membrane protein